MLLLSKSRDSSLSFCSNQLCFKFGPQELPKARLFIPFAIVLIDLARWVAQYAKTDLEFLV